jgi:putative aldouronate transport system permease protein
MFQLINGFFLIVLSLSMIAPIIHLAAVSLSSYEYASAKLVTFWPKGFNLEVYKTIVKNTAIWKAMGVSVYITVVGTLITLVLGSSLAYSLSRTTMPARKIILQLILVTFVFPAPLIPTYLLIKQLGMVNTLWSLMIPGALGAYYVFIIKTFFQGISNELFDAAKIDGNNEFGIYSRIVIPLSTPVMATIALFHVVSQWNSYFSALIYIRSKDMYPLQVLLRNMVIDGQANGMSTGSSFQLSSSATPEMMKAGIIMFATLPILVVYPFLQKYFVKGAMLGSLKE